MDLPVLPMWKPTTTQLALQMRAEVLAKIREFFSIRKVMEVETPLLSQHSVTDPHIASLSLECLLPGNASARKLYLQTSPEFAMKRLLAAGSGPIYQICKAFRSDESGRLHNPEFTMLEWYRPGFTHRDLMIETDGLLRRILNSEVAKCQTYQELFEHYCALDPFKTNVSELKACAKKNNIPVEHLENVNDITPWLQLLMHALIEPHLGFHNQPCIVTDFPIAQAALSRADRYNPDVAERFEVYWQGMELANGFHELCDANEQRRRFEADNVWRKENGLPEMPIDERFLAALEHGLPSCAGIALGVDRLIMAAMSSKELSEVLAFPLERA